MEDQVDPVSIARWLKNVMQYGLQCKLVNGHKVLGRRGNFEDACLRMTLRINREFITFKPGGYTIALKEVSAVEGHTATPTASGPAFGRAQNDIAKTLVTLRWRRAGKHATHGEYVHILFYTRVDTIVFIAGMGRLLRHGVRATLEGYVKNEGLLQPSAFQVARSRERFAHVFKRYHSRKTSPAVDTEVDPVDTSHLDLQPKEDDYTARSLWLSISEDAETYIFWSEKLAGRCAIDLRKDELECLIDRGVPLKYKHILWPQWLAETCVIDQVSLEAMQHCAMPDSVKMVASDLPRTKPLCQSVVLNDVQLASLKRILLAYSARNPNLGYCQGMNYIVMVFLLLGFDDMVAFAGLCFFVEMVCPGYHEPGLEGFLRDVTVLDVFLTTFLPGIAHTLEMFDVPLDILVMEHFLSLTSRSLSFGATLRFWDLFMVEGTPALFASFLAMLERYFPVAVKTVMGMDNDELVLPAADVMDQFKKCLISMEGKDMDEIIRRTRHYLECMPLSSIQSVRAQL